MISEEQILNAKILAVDDQELSIRLLVGILEKAGYRNITQTTDPRLASKLYEKIMPDLIILDLNMPYMDGFQVMSQIRQLEGDNYLPLLMISGEENHEMRFLALESGAKDFLKKPYDRVEVLVRIRNIIEVRMLHNEVRNQNKILDFKVNQRTQELYETQLDVIQRLARAVEFRDTETGMHIIRMSHFSAMLAAQAGLKKDICDLILAASPLHDIGKIGIPDSILRKPGKLTPEEWEIMKTHTTIGAELLKGGNSQFLIMASEIALTHHEKWDGTGYPYGISGERIPLIGRICCLCDVFDALMTKRPYKNAWSIEATLEEIRKGKDAHFDPRLVDLFLKIVPELRHVHEKYADQDVKPIDKNPTV